MDADKATPKIITHDNDIKKSYRAYRYLQDIPEDELYQYVRDAFRNFMTINEQGKTAPLPVSHPAHWYWRCRLIHIVEELCIRDEGYPRGLNDVFAKSIRLPRADSLRAINAFSAVNHQLLAKGEHLVKYGQKTYVLDMFNKGLFRISPASSYAASEYNDAIADTELKFTYNLYNSSPEVISRYAVVPSSLTTKDLLYGTAFLELTQHEDYYLFCLSTLYSPRLFDDFESDACLIIHSPVEFRNRLMRSVENQVKSKSWAFSEVTYLDPFSIPNPSHHPYLCKHHRYAYQNELRAAWQMHEGSSHKLDAVYVELGSLENIAQVVCINTE